MPQDPSSFKRPNTPSKPLRQFPTIGVEDMPNPPSYPPQAQNMPFPPQNSPIELPVNYNHQDPFELPETDRKLLNQARQQAAQAPIAPSAKQRLEYLADLG